MFGAGLLETTKVLRARGSAWAAMAALVVALYVTDAEVSTRLGRGQRAAVQGAQQAEKRKTKKYYNLFYI